MAEELSWGEVRIPIYTAKRYFTILLFWRIPLVLQGKNQKLMVPYVNTRDNLHSELFYLEFQLKFHKFDSTDKEGQSCKPGLENMHDLVHVQLQENNLSEMT